MSPSATTPRSPCTSGDPGSRGEGGFALEFQGDVDELVFLAADELAFACADEHFGGGDAVAFGLAFGVAQEAGVDAGVAHREGLAVEEAFRGHGGADDVFGGVGDGEEVDAGLDAEFVADADEGFDRQVAGAGAEAAGRAVDLGGACAYGVDGVRDGEAEVFVTAVEADLGVVAEFCDQGRDMIGNLFQDERTGRVDDVDALAAGIGP